MLSIISKKRNLLAMSMLLLFCSQASVEARQNGIKPDRVVNIGTAIRFGAMPYWHGVVTPPAQMPSWYYP
jgi:hypothetical protein